MLLGAEISLERESDILSCIIRPYLSKITQDLSQRRRDQWIANIKRDSVTNGDIKNPYACSLHFQQGNSLQLEDIIFYFNSVASS